MTAADAFTTCARDSPSKQINERLAYYGAAGECYSEACDLKHAGDSYRMAENYAAAARMYQKGGYFDEMAEMITRHCDSNALEVADIHAKNRDVLGAVEILITSQAARSADYVQLSTIECILTGLRRSLTLGVPPASSPTASKLLAYADKLDNGAMTEQEVDEVSPSHPFNLQVLYLAPPARNVSSDPTHRPCKPPNICQDFRWDGERPCRSVVPGPHLLIASRATKSPTSRG